jgi:hypothetical protein
MELIDNTNVLFGDDLKQALRADARLKVAACGSEVKCL